MVLDETPKKEMPLVPNAQQQQIIQKSPVSVRHSTQWSRFPERFSPSLYSILLTNSSEPKEYKDVI